jgi:hypothetical protein
MKLKKAQREALLAWIAEGLQSDEINKRATLFEPTFEVTRQQVDHYRKTRNIEIQKLRKDGEYTALNTGLAIREKRVELLQELAERMRDDLLVKKLLWTPQVKGIGSADNYERIDYEEFNSAEVQQLRGVLDDIAAEVNERVRRQEVTGKDGKPLIPSTKFDLSNLSDEEINAIDQAVLTLERHSHSDTSVKNGN